MLLIEFGFQDCLTFSYALFGYIRGKKKGKEMKEKKKEREEEKENASLISVWKSEGKEKRKETKRKE